MNWRGLFAGSRAVWRTPEVIAEHCVYARLPFASCERCVAACPTSAWRWQDDQLAIDPDQCDGCGLCAAACPEGAMTQDHEPELRRLQGEVIAFAACEQTVAGLPATIPCVHAFGMTQLARLYGEGVRACAVCAADCDACPRGAGERLSERLTLLNRVLRHRGLPQMDLRFLGPRAWRRRYEAASPGGSGTHVTRRGFLRGVLAAAATVDQGQSARPRDAPGQYLPGAGEPCSALFAPRIDEHRCSGCDACVRVCPHAAIRLEPAPAAYRVAADACTGCGLCADVCDSGAIAVEVAAAVAATRVPLHEGRCRSCGAEIHSPRPQGLGEPLCHVCVRVNHPRQLFQVL